MSFDREHFIVNEPLIHYDAIVNFIELVCRQLFSDEPFLYAIKIRKADKFMLKYDKFVGHLRGQTRPFAGIIEIFVEDGISL